MGLLRLISAKLLEPIYFSLFLIIGKDLKNKRFLLTLIMIFEYVMLKEFIKFDVLFQVIYTFMSFINLKVLYKEKAQVTDIFLFAGASIILILLSMFTYLTALYTYKNYMISLIFNRILIFDFIFIFRKQIRKLYKEFYSLWNRHSKPNKIKSLTLRNISIIVFNVMFWFINLGMIYFVTYLK